MPALSAAKGYLWKCWRDTRSTFLVLAGAILAVAAFGLYVKLDPFGWITAKPLELRAVWTATADALLGMAVGLAPVAGFVLGALGVGVEFEKGTADFLLTRPRSHRYLLWANWAVGAAQMAALVLLGIVLQFLRTAGPFRIQGAGDLLRSVTGYGVVAFFIYSLTYQMTTLARNSRNGTGWAILAVSAYGGLVTWMQLWYQVRLPIFLDLYSPGYRGEPGYLPAAAAWLALGLVFMLVAQWRFRRAEV